MTNIFDEFKPDLLLVHGDTTTTFACALSAYYKKIPVGHIEADLEPETYTHLGQRKQIDSLQV